MPLQRLRCGRSAVCGAGSSPFEGHAACGFGRPLGGRMHCLGFLSSASPGSAACGFGRPLGGRMHCLDLLSSASPGPAACGFGHSAGGRMHCLDLFSSASPGPAACGFGRSAGGRMYCLGSLWAYIAGSCRLRKSVACPRGRDKPAGRSYAPGGGGRLRSGEPSRKRAPEHPVPSDDGERAGIAVRPKKIGTARERQPRPQTPAKELI